MTGRPDYDAGDLVVCVSKDSKHPVVQYGKVFRVLSIGLGRLKGLLVWGCVLEGAEPRGGKTYFHADRFRRIDPKPPEFWTGTVDADAGERVPA